MVSQETSEQANKEANRYIKTNRTVAIQVTSINTPVRLARTGA